MSRRRNRRVRVQPGERYRIKWRIHDRKTLVEVESFAFGNEWVQCIPTFYARGESTQQPAMLIAFRVLDGPYPGETVSVTRRIWMQHKPEPAA